MGVVQDFQAPRPVPIQVRSRRPGKQFAAALEGAITERRYSNPRGNEVLLRLMSGSVEWPEATFTAKTYDAPEIRSRGNIDKLVVGTISDKSAGSEFDGLVSVPMRGRSLYLIAAWVAVLTVLLMGLVVSVASTSDTVRGVAPFATLLALIAPILVTLWAVRRSQRTNLLYDFDSVKRFVQTIADDS